MILLLTIHLKLQALHLSKIVVIKYSTGDDDEKPVGRAVQTTKKNRHILNGY